MKEKVRRIIGLILIIAGLSIIVSIVYKKIETTKKQKELQNILENIINNEGDQGVEQEEKEFTIESINGYTPIALIEIPSINLSQGVVEGINDDVLQYYLGHFETSAKPGENGNFAIAGHRVSDYSEAFVNLYKTEIGDDIIVKTNKKEYVYQITDSYIVGPDRVDVLDDTEEPTITLVTCTVGAKERFIVKGKLVNTIDMKIKGE